MPTPGTRVSAPEASSPTGGAAGVAIGVCRLDLTELAVLRGHAADLPAVARSGGVALPPTGRVAVSASALVLSVRPERWLLLTSPAAAGAGAAAWSERCAGLAAVIDHSSGLAALHLAGPSAREALARGCRLDLAMDAFPPGHAAATSMAQVATILAALPSGLLILTPASTARHLHEWLMGAARPFGLAPLAEITVSTFFGHNDP